MTARVRLHLCAFVLLMCLLPLPLHAGGGELNPNLRAHPGALQRWKEMRFGMFIHWGPVALRGTEIGWSRGKEVPIVDYDSLYREFNPVLFNASEWVGAARDAGVKYLVITSKHHDGFCLWPSKYTEYSVASSPFRRDVLRELADACREQGVLFGTYYSILDWHHPDYTTRYGGDPRPVELSDMNRYRVYLKNQVRELIEEYGTNILWFDGEWEASWTHADGMELYAFGRSLKDSLLINNRVDTGRNGMKGMTASDAFAGDFGTPEQEVGAFDNSRPWESCITICTQWSWKPNDRMKSLRECIHMLAKTAGGGGNLLLNISPMPDGRIERRQIRRLKEIGEWMSANGEAIYGTDGGPYVPTSWLTSTRRGNRVYIHLLARPVDTLRLPLPATVNVKGVSLLHGKALSTTTVHGMLEIALPPVLPDSNDAVLSVELDGPAANIAPMEVPVQRISAVGHVRFSQLPRTPYDAGGAAALVDNIRGTNDYRDGRWLGFEGDDLDATIELDAPRNVEQVSFGYLQRQESWIFPPTSVEVSVSADGSRWSPPITAALPPLVQGGPTDVGEINVLVKAAKVRYVRLHVASQGSCPLWHAGRGGKAWLFVDEVTVR